MDTAAQSYKQGYECMPRSYYFLDRLKMGDGSAQTFQVFGLAPTLYSPRFAQTWSTFTHARRYQRQADPLE